MNADLRNSFRLWFVTSEVGAPVPPTSELLRRVQANPSWDTASIHPAEAQFPLVHIEWHDGNGFVIQSYEDDQSWSYFLASGQRLGAPSIAIELGGQALERWPSELFVFAELALRALDHFLQSGKQDPSLYWVRIDAFPREIVWEGAAGREAWGRANQSIRRDV